MNVASLLKKRLVKNDTCVEIIDICMYLEVLEERIEERLKEVHYELNKLKAKII